MPYAIVGDFSRLQWILFRCIRVKWAEYDCTTLFKALLLMKPCAIFLPLVNFTLLVLICHMKSGQSVLTTVVMQ